jgi:uncharacterized protein YkwD
MKYFILLAALPLALIGISNAASAASVSAAADSLTVSGCANNGPIGGGVVALHCAGDIHGAIVFPGSANGTYQIGIVARANPVFGILFPNAQVSIDRVVVGTISVTSTSFATYTLNDVVASAGSHLVSIAFTNPYASSRQDLTLYIQSVTITPASSVSTTQPPPSGSPDAYQQQLLNLVNQSRAAGGLGPLTFSAVQSSGTDTCVGSYGHSVHMEQQGQISHDQFPQDICISWSAAGENVGEAGGSEGSAIQALHQQMMAEGPSGGHYRNIMSTTFTTIGIGLFYVNNTLWLTEDFIK